MRFPRAFLWFWTSFCVLAAGSCQRASGQAALLLEDAAGFSSVLSPSGHVALYFARICADTPTRLRRCGPGELGTVISRYEGIKGRDWLAIPLLPHLYAVEDPLTVPTHVDHASVAELRQAYHDAHLTVLGNVPVGGRLMPGWNQLVGAAFERRIYAFRFETTPEQDDALIARLNDSPQVPHFNFITRNCADFVSDILNEYFPGAFKRRILPDAGITMPRQTAYQLECYARKHPELHLQLMEIPQIPGYRRESGRSKSVAGSLVFTGDLIPLALLDPYVAAGVLADYLIFGRYPLARRHPEILSPQTMAILAGSAISNMGSANMSIAEAASQGVSGVAGPANANSTNQSAGGSTNPGDAETTPGGEALEANAARQAHR
ncbi:MAG TPA: hypothetical protein VGG45_11735 [Terracidiphilus sp.]|jgi:hypothetical protein